jgi:hypothetical protein
MQRMGNYHAVDGPFPVHPSQSNARGLACFALSSAFTIRPMHSLEEMGQPMPLLTSDISNSF